VLTVRKRSRGLLVSERFDDCRRKPGFGWFHPRSRSRASLAVVLTIDMVRERTEPASLPLPDMPESDETDSRGERLL
jgi:hypothetical protein